MAQGEKETGEMPGLAMLFGSRIFIGVLGTVILAAFLSGLMSAEKLAGLLPLVVAFNGALTGFNIIEKAKNGIRRKLLAGSLAGMATGAAAFAALNALYFYLTGGYLLSASGLPLLSVCGFVSAGAAAMLAVRYFDLKK